MKGPPTLLSPLTPFTKPLAAPLCALRTSLRANKGTRSRSNSATRVDCTAMHPCLLDCAAVHTSSVHRRGVFTTHETWMTSPCIYERTQEKRSLTPPGPKCANLSRELLLALNRWWFFVFRYWEALEVRTLRSSGKRFSERGPETGRRALHHFPFERRSNDTLRAFGDRSWPKWSTLSQDPLVLPAPSNMTFKNSMPIWEMRYWCNTTWATV